MVFQNEIGHLERRVNPHKPVKKHGKKADGMDPILTSVIPFYVKSGHGPLR